MRKDRMQQRPVRCEKSYKESCFSSLNSSVVHLTDIKSKTITKAPPLLSGYPMRMEVR